MVVGYKIYLHTNMEPARTAKVQDEINQKDMDGDDDIRTGC
jgi:hypothetical protein